MMSTLSHRQWRVLTPRGTIECISDISVQTFMEEVRL